MKVNESVNGINIQTGASVRCADMKAFLKRKHGRCKRCVESAIITGPDGKDCQFCHRYNSRCQLVSRNCKAPVEGYK